MSASSRGRSSVVKIAPRNSHEPNSRETRLVCLPCQPRPAACASGFSITAAVSTNTLTSQPDGADQPSRQRLQPLLDQVVIVVALRIDRDRAARAALENRKRIFVGAVIDAEHDDRAHISPQPARIGAALGVSREPVHVAMRAGFEEIAKMFSGIREHIRTGHADAVEPERARFAIERLEMPSSKQSRSPLPWGGRSRSDPVRGFATDRPLTPTLSQGRRCASRQRRDDQKSRST